MAQLTGPYLPGTAQRLNLFEQRFNVLGLALDQVVALHP